MRNRGLFIFSLMAGLTIILFFNPFFFPQLAPRIDDFSAKITRGLSKKNNYNYGKIVLVAIDDNSLRAVPHRWPWPRSIYAKAVYILNQEKAKVIGFDVTFVGDGISPKDDQVFTDTLSIVPNPVVLAYFLDKNANPIYPKEEFIRKAAIAFINSPTDKDGAIRVLRGWYKFGGSVDFSWAIKIAGIYLNEKPQLGDRCVKLGGRNVPISRDGIFPVNFMIGTKEITAISFSDLLKKKFPPGLFKGKIVLIGSTAAIIRDTHFTPLGKMPGIFVHINGIYNILEQKSLAPVPAVFVMLVLILVLIGLPAVITVFSFMRGFFLCMGIFFGVIWLDIGLRCLGFDFPTGKIIIVSVFYLSMIYFVTYINFISLIAQVKDRMTKDPLTGLSTMRYFLERLQVDLRSIPRRVKFLTIIVLDDFHFLTKGESFSGLKIIWEDISECLRLTSGNWARFSQDSIVGSCRNRENAEKAGIFVTNVLFKVNFRIKVKCGIVALRPNLIFEDVLPHLVSIVRKNKEQLIIFPDNILDGFARKKTGSERIVSSLFLDVEAKNKELMDTIEQLKEEEKKTKDAFLDLVSSLVNAIESKDNYTKGHTQRVCDYSLMLTNRLCLLEEEKERIRKAALLHDLGKIGIPDTVLHKPGRLTDEEFAVIKQHPIMTANILKPIKEFYDVIPYALHHHEKYDGTGYPQGLSGEQIPLGARIIAIADVYDALTTGRDYKPAFSASDTLAEMVRQKGKQFDPVLLDEFIAALKSEEIRKL